MPGFFREPLLHFVLAGAVLFALHAAVNRADDKQTATAAGVRVNASDVAWLTASWIRQWQRPPTPEEVRGLIGDYVNEQLLAREARALGLDDNDVVVRRRLAQKLTFIIEGSLRHVEATDEELRQFYERHAGRFRTEARISFAHIYFSPQHRADAVADAREALGTLVDGAAQPPGFAASLGDRSLLEARFEDETEKGLSAIFGPDFAQAVFALDAGAWAGPIRSGYGVHLVRVSHLSPARLRPFAEVRAQVLAEWQGEQETAARERYLAELRKKYSVVIDAAAQPLPATSAATQSTGR